MSIIKLGARVLSLILISSVVISHSTNLAQSNNNDNAIDCQFLIDGSSDGSYKCIPRDLVSSLDLRANQLVNELQLADGSSQPTYDARSKIRVSQQQQPTSTKTTNDRDDHSNIDLDKLNEKFRYDTIDLPENSISGSSDEFPVGDAYSLSRLFSKMRRQSGNYLKYINNDQQATSLTSNSNNNRRERKRTLGSLLQKEDKDYSSMIVNGANGGNNGQQHPSSPKETDKSWANQVLRDIISANNHRFSRFTSAENIAGRPNQDSVVLSQYKNSDGPSANGNAIYHVPNIDNRAQVSKRNDDDCLSTLKDPSTCEVDFFTNDANEEELSRVDGRGRGAKRGEEGKKGRKGRKGRKSDIESNGDATGKLGATEEEIPGFLMINGKWARVAWKGIGRR